MPKPNIKKIMSWGIGIPAAIVVCSEAHNDYGFTLQIAALAVLITILAANGMFFQKKER